MGRPKAELEYFGKPQWLRLEELLSKYCAKVFISTSKNWSLNNFPFNKGGRGIFLDPEGESFGPLTGILEAMKHNREAAWLVLACDMPFFDTTAINELITHRDPQKPATAFTSETPPFNKGGQGGFFSAVEPLCTIYEPKIYDHLIHFWQNKTYCPRKILSQLDIKRVIPSSFQWLENVNSWDEYADVVRKIPLPPLLKGEMIGVRVFYFASLKDARGVSSEQISSNAGSARELYESLAAQHGFESRPKHLRVAINNELVPWETPLKSGDQIAFLPPFAGG